MPQAVVDPEELERFARNLKQFNEELKGRMSRLQGQFMALGDTWHDQEHARFAQEFQQTMATLRNFTLVAATHIPFLFRKAQRGRAYFSEGAVSSSGGASSFTISDQAVFSSTFL